MKTRTSSFVALGWSAALLASSCLCARGQSGRVLSGGPKRAAPPPAPAAPPFVVPRDAQKYLLVYAPGVEKDEALAGEKGRHARFDGFVKQLNYAGARGYRLLAVTDAENPVAVVKLDRAQYEYGWFETGGSGLWITNDGFEPVFGKQAEGGFRLAEHFFISKYCEQRDPDAIWMGELCYLTDLYLVERRKGAEGPRQYQLVGTMPGWRANLSRDLTAKVNELLEAGLYPTHAFSRFEMLLEEAEVGAGPRPDVQVVALSTWGKGSIEKKVNEQARLGYRLDMVGPKVAVLRRGTGPLSYVWVKAKEKDFAKRLAELQAAGAAYRMTYKDGDGRETRLVFELGESGHGRREYRVLRLEPEAAPADKKKAGAPPRPPSEESLKAFEGLLREGFEVRDLFVTDVAHVLLERPR